MVIPHFVGPFIYQWTLGLLPPFAYNAALNTGVLNLLFKKIYLFIFRERGSEGERLGEKYPCSHMPPTGDLAHNPGMYPDWEVNWQPFD